VTTPEQKPWQNRIVGEALVDAAELAANPLNFRTHGADQQRALTGAIERLGWIQRVVVNRRTGLIVDGHLRAKLAQRHGQLVPVIYVDLDEDEERMALATLDPIAAMAGQDDANLAQLLAGIEAGNASLDSFLDGMRAQLADSRAPKPGKTDPDDAPPPPALVRSSVGETWLLGQHRLQIGDATDPHVVGKAMGGHLADAVWTDPPYNVDYAGSDGQKIANDNMGSGAFRTFLTKLLAAAIAHTSPGAPIYIAHADSEGLNFRQAALDAGWSLRQALVWVKNAFTMGRQDYQWQHEPILYGWKPGAAHRWYGERTKSTVIDDRVDVDSLPKKDLVALAKALIAQAHPSVLDFPKPGRNDIHPTMKPVALIHATLGNSALPEDHVLDVCAGSGSTLIACEQLGMVAHLCELDPRYADAIITRWQEFTGGKAFRLSDQTAFNHLTPREIPRNEPETTA
jgi:DNA modification methylase